MVNIYLKPAYTFKTYMNVPQMKHWTFFSRFLRCRADTELNTYVGALGLMSGVCSDVEGCW